MLTERSVTELKRELTRAIMQLENGEPENALVSARFALKWLEAPARCLWCNHEARLDRGPVEADSYHAGCRETMERSKVARSPSRGRI